MPGPRTLASAVAIAYRVTRTILQMRAGATVVTWKANPGQDFEWEELWSKTGDEQSGRRMYTYFEQEGNTA